MGLFDKHHYHNHGTQHHSHYTTVTENRAPTDESVSLLRDMEDKAIGNIVHRLKLEDNVFGEVLVLQQAFTLDTVVSFKLNGKTYSFTVNDTDIANTKAMPHSYTNVLFDKMSKIIAEKLFMGVFTNK